MASRREENINIGDWSKFIGRLFHEAASYLEARGDLAHAEVSHQYAVDLMKREGGDKRIVEPAVILHDVGWSCLEPDQIKVAYGVNADGEEAKRLNRIHEEEGASIAIQVLERLHYEPRLIMKIASIIKMHDSGRNVHSLEEAVVKDADKLWRFSETGFSKEIERQQITPSELYRHLAKYKVTWFFTRTALNLATRELTKRKKQFQVNP